MHDLPSMIGCHALMNPPWCSKQKDGVGECDRIIFIWGGGPNSGFIWPLVRAEGT